MRRRHLRIRRWLAIAAAVATLSIAASASAMPGGDGGGGQTVYPQQPVAAPSDTSGGFSWSDAAIGAGVALGVAIGAGAIVRSKSNHRRLAGVTQ